MSSVTASKAHSSPQTATRRGPRCVCIDIETPSSGAAVLHKIAAFRADTGQQALFMGRFDAADVCTALNALADGAEFVLGHNIRRHDLPVLSQLLPGLALSTLPVVDTLELSPLAFPENPYHRLVKDYKLVSDARNLPLRDAELSLELFHEEVRALRDLHGRRPHDVALFHYLLAGDEDAKGLASLFKTVRRALRPTHAAAIRHLQSALDENVCSTRLRRLADSDLRERSLHYPLAYLVAWLRVAGGNSVLPPWVHGTFPETTRLIRELRETPCGDAACTYCCAQHHPEAQLTHYFGLACFRPHPQTASGGSLQREVVVAGLRGESLIAILPTGAGKSLCYQLPALCRYWRSARLTVIVSPLQSLMKDQVDNLVKRGIYCAVAINGLLTPPERRAAIDKVRLGDAGMVFVSPEQFRNRSFVEAITCREIAAWVFDEAHCLSRWGHDFRTDYLYVSRFIRERYAARGAPIACFTATAKPDVIADLCEHFRRELAIELARFAGGHERANLQYEVLPVIRAEKPARVIALLAETLDDEKGGAVVFAATRKNAETMSEHIAAAGWTCAHFHGGLEPGSKRQIQQDFVAGALRVIVATNAFGMGVDKPDIRLVIHADIPGSLENYLQEAGRAGRDGGTARCVLLYDEEDVETQFRLSARSRLAHRDFVGVLKALRKRSRRLGGEPIVVTAKELLLGEDDELGIDPDAPDAATKVKTAIAWLERAQLLRREENQTRVFSASLKVQSLEEADAKLGRANLPPDARERYRRVLELIVSAEAEEGISTDEIVHAAGIAANECFRTLHNLEALGLLANDLGLRVVLRKGVRDPSEARFERVASMERALVDLMAEHAPDADGSEPQALSLAMLCEGLRERIGERVAPETVFPDRVLDLLRALAQSFGNGEGKRAMLTLRKVGPGELRLRVQRPWSQIREITETRRAAAQVVLRTLLAKVPEGIRSADAIVECKAQELLDALASDLEIAAQLRDRAIALEQALLYLHETEVLILDKGRTVFRSAMTLRLLEREGAGRFSREDYKPLERHYSERNFQIHVMHEYAKRAMKKVADALALVAAYFSWGRERFVKEHFAGRKELLQFATTAESYEKIVDALHHPIQAQLVQEREGTNRLVLAGPGSGKTKVVVHRVAYLLRVERVPSDSVIVLTFNRSAAVEVRRRLRALVGDDAAGVAVLTYHAMAMRLTGMSLGVLAETGVKPDFDAVVRRAVDLLEGRIEAGADPDDLRDRLLKGYRFILVDEYQDIDALQYELVSALAGRTRKEGESKLTIMAVGDDDQNIYAFRSTSVEFIRRFEADYAAKKSYLVENFRSSQHVIAVANHLIQQAPDRMKVDYPIRIDHARSAAAPGGRWMRLDPLGEGRVQIIRTSPNANVQAQLAMTEVLRLRALDPGADWADFAILARTHAALEPLRAYCELKGIPYRTGERAGQGSLSAMKTREGHRVLVALRGKEGRLASSRALARWLGRLARHDPRNPWLAELRDCAADLESAVGGAPVPRNDAIDWLYESAGDCAREAPGHLNLLTAHGAKGREFVHVLVVDAGDWTHATPDERRLLYVAMTRARETLALFRAVPGGNPLLEGLEDLEAVRSVEPKVAPLPARELNRLHRELTLADVDLSYAGRWPGDAPIHRTIARLRCGDPLRLDGAELLDGAGRRVGRLARTCQLPSGEVSSARVHAVVRRTARQSHEAYRSTLKVDVWETVLPEIVIEPR
jgi:ATP-dependent DNA helicase RecQ